MSEEMNYVENREFREGDIVKAVAAQVDEKSVTYQSKVHRLMGLCQLVNFLAYTLKKLLILYQ